MAGAEVIMTSTLPTVVGMGVVSRSTETMFGRGRRRASKSRPRKDKFKIYRGKRGGQYILRKGRKIYI